MGVRATIITFTIAAIGFAVPHDPLHEALALDFGRQGTVVDRQAREAAYAAACAAGSAVACEAEVWRRTGALSPRIAGERLSEACDDGEAAACLAVGWMTDDVAMLRRSCEAGLVDACVELAASLPDARGLPLLTEACEEGEAAACRVVGERTRDRARLVQGCDLGDATACRLGGLREAACSLQDAGSCLALAEDGLADWPVALLSAGCAASEPQTCAQLAGLYAAGSGVTRSDAIAGQLHRVACDGGVLDSCAAADDNDTAWQRLRCERGDPAGCQHLGRMAYAEDETAGLARLKEACGLGGVSACSDLGHVLLGMGRIDAAETLWGQTCAADDAGGCAGLASLIRAGEGRKADLTEAAELDLKACDLDPARCETAARLSLRGLGMAADADAAAGFLEAACEAGDASACTNLGWRLHLGRSVEADPVGARQLWEAACGGGDSAACTAITYVDDGDLTALRAPCEAGDPAACAGLGVAYAIGRGVEADPTYGVSLLQDACMAEPVCAWGECEASGAVACRWLGHLTAQGVGVKASRREAKRTTQRACELGDLLSCGG